MRLYEQSARVINLVNEKNEKKKKLTRTNFIHVHDDYLMHGDI